jgi:tRNA dimethylallyltransferase
VGPTASGKSALALQLAHELQGEIVSCDSLQVYRGLDIGSAKASAQERREVPHHLLDVVAPGQPFSAAEYASLARAALAGIRARGRLAIVAGGTGLYLRALLQGLFAGPARDEELRRRLERLAERFGDGRLHRLLSRVDPAAAVRIARQDRVRVVRALEVYYLSGRPISAQQRQGSEPLQGFDVRLVGLDPGRARLRLAVEARTREMIERGLVDEVRGLLQRGCTPALRPLQAIGYRQAVAVATGRLTVAQAERSMVVETLRFAKRQMTWFRHQQRDICWFAEAEAARVAIQGWLDERARHGAEGRSSPP